MSKKELKMSAAM